MTDYGDSFKDDMPQLEAEKGDREVKAAVLRFIQEVKKQAIYLSAQVTTVNETGEMEVGTTPMTVIQQKPERRVARITNRGPITCMVYAGEKGYPFNVGSEIIVHGSNPIEVATVSGTSVISWLDS